MDQDQPRRRRRLSAEDKWQIFTEASAKVADVLRRWRIDSSQLARIRTQVKEGSLTPAQKGSRTQSQGPGEGSAERRGVASRGRLQGSVDREHPATKKSGWA
jgi:transposase-like protein